MTDMQQSESDQPAPATGAGSPPPAEARRPAHSAPQAPLTARATAWLGWVLFISIIMLAAGLINIAQGMVALFDDDFYGASAAGLAVGASYTAWGIALLVLGVALVAGAYGVLTGYGWGRTIGVVAAAVNALVNLGFAAAYPGWTVLAVSFDVIAIYALVVHGGAARALRTSRR
ncbi:DUF7144 family membrane protein [Nucisporomicrobium flavum]|uniref:DUF7144 family membrane protein n=1 Tax=Nucisporomicrobium flavum TaxID=2785915 RepID=UPI003C2E3E5E